MNDKLDPKLQEFEAKLRRLKPLNRTMKAGSRVAWSDRSVSFHLRVIGSGLLAASAIIVAVAWLLSPPPQPVEPLVVTASPQFSTQRKQLLDLYDEITPADVVEVKKPVYPVVEIEVKNSPPMIRAAVPGFGFPRLRFDEKLPPF